MNVIFEGLSGVGKTTVMEEVCKELETNNIPYEAIGDLLYETPIKNVLLEMVSKDPLMNANEKFNTSLYESLLLAANHHYVQEKLRGSNKICLYDRDFLSLLAYQKVLIDNEYKNGDEIYDIYKKLVLLNLKTVDYIFYIETPLDILVERTEKRDNRIFSDDDISSLIKIKERYLIEIEDFKDKVVFLNGEDTIENNKEKVLNYIKRGM